jgi:dUTP pyrophosphatase
LTAGAAGPAIAVRRLSHALEPTPLDLPSRATPGSAGFDVHAAVVEPLVVEPRARVLVPTGLVLGIPDGFEVQVRPRSGRAWREGLTVLNAPGTIDADYRGELLVLLVNLGDAPVTITRGDRVAQLVVAPVVAAVFVSADALDETGRGVGGFGHTGA